MAEPGDDIIIADDLGKNLALRYVYELDNCH